MRLHKLRVSSCPACPACDKDAGQPQTAVVVGLSSTSSTSSTKTSNVKENDKDIHYPPLPMDWTPDTIEGRPCCYLPYVSERLRGILPPDLRGFGIPAEGLSSCLRQFSLAGWQLEQDGEEVRMVKAHPHARMEQGCIGYLRVNSRRVLQELRQWNVDKS